MINFQHILDRHKLTLLEVLSQSDGGLIRSDVLLCSDKNDKKLILKYFNSDDVYARKRFIDEINNIYKIRDAVSVNNKKLFPKIRYKRIKTEGDIYYIYDYFKGKPLGIYNKDFGVSYGIFKQENFPKFLRNLCIIADFDCNKIAGVTRKYNFNRVKSELDFYKGVYDSHQSKNLKGGDYRDFLYSNHESVFKSKNLSVCQTDLYPANILVDRAGGKVFKFLDWEYLSYAPIGFLPAFLFLMFWKEEFWNSKIYAFFYNYYVHDKAYSEDVFTLSFRYCLIVLGLRFWYQSYSLSDSGGNEHLRTSSMSTFSHFINSAVDGSIVKPTNVKFYIDKWDVEKIASIYNLEKVLKSKVFYSGKGNTVIKVETEGKKKYIFRFYYRNRTSQMIKNELSIYDKLSSSGISTYKVFKSPNGELFITQKIYGRKRRVAVLSYLEGSRINRKWDSEKSMQSLGSILRSVHKLGVIHNDFSKENVLFTKGKITGLIDFEWGVFTNNPSMHRKDLAKTIALWLTDIRERFLSGELFIYNILLGYYGNKLPKKKILESILARVKYNLIKEEKIYVNIFYVHLSENHKRKALTRFIHAKSSLDLFRKEYIG